MVQHRAQRVSETIREELSEIIGYELSDPRIGTVDVTEVLVGAGMRHARVRLHLGGDEKEREQSLLALGRARHFLRRALAARLRLFRIPEIHFEADLEVSTVERVEQLLQRVRKDPSESSGPEEKSSLE